MPYLKDMHSGAAPGFSNAIRTGYLPAAGCAVRRPPFAMPGFQSFPSGFPPHNTRHSQKEGKPMSKKLTPQTIALSGVLAAIIFVATYLFKIPMLTGYVHLGDGFILLAASILGWPAVAAAAIGSMLADLLAGYTAYMLPTFLIKGAVAAIAVVASTKKSQPVQLLYMLIAETAMVAGYFATDWLLYGLGTAAPALMGNVMQGLSGVAIWVLLMPVAKRVQKRP